MVFMQLSCLYETHEIGKSPDFLQGPRSLDVVEIGNVQLKVGDKWLHRLFHFT